MREGGRKRDWGEGEKEGEKEVSAIYVCWVDVVCCVFRTHARARHLCQPVELKVKNFLPGRWCINCLCG